MRYWSRQSVGPGTTIPPPAGDRRTSHRPHRRAVHSAGTSAILGAVTSDLRLGFGLPVSGSWATPGNVSAVARRAEELGYATLWTFQRVVVPADEDYGPSYRSVLDPVVALGFAAAVTSEIRVGTATVCTPFLSPTILAKQLATVDVLSGGRLDVGLG